MRRQRLYRPVRRNKSYWDRVDPTQRKSQPQRDSREFDTSSNGHISCNCHGPSKLYCTANCPAHDYGSVFTAPYPDRYFAPNANACASAH